MAAPGNVLVPARATRLSKDPVVNVSQLITLDRSALAEHVAKLSRWRRESIPSGIDVVLGRYTQLGGVEAAVDARIWGRR